MRFYKQQPELKVKDLSDFVPDAKKTKSHGELLPSSIRCIICGPSNCGKTALMLTLLQDLNGLRFENVYVYSKSLHQPKYQLLEKLLDLVDGIGYFPFSDSSEIIDPHEAQPNSIFVFDDVACHSQDRIREYFSMGRHQKIDCFYLCQTYSRIPKQLIRDNCNLIAIFKQDEMNLKHVYDDHVGTDMPFQKFHDICSTCWNENRFMFVVIDKDRPLLGGRYRKGLDVFIEP